MRIPMLDLVRQYESIHDEIDSAVLGVVRSGNYVLGSHVKEFEGKVAEYCGCRHAIGVASGTDALLLSLKALGIGPGDGVLLPSFTFFATAGIVHNVGATPVFCDIDPKTYNIDPASARAVLETHATLRTAHRAPSNPTSSRSSADPKNASIRAIIPVHLYGQMADMNELLAIAAEHDLAVVEDAAQAIGAVYKGRKAGTIGAAGCFSFYPTKNLGAYGDGGLVTSDDDALAERVALLRVHGAHPKYFHKVVGLNSRLDAIQAAILRAKLTHLDAWSRARQEVADRYDAALANVPGLVTPFRAADRSHIFHQYTIRVLHGKRDALQAHLKARGIGTMIYYPLPLHLQECFAHLGGHEGDFRHSEAASREVLSLPIFPELTQQEQDAVVAAIREFAARGS